MHSTLALCRILTSSPPTNAKKNQYNPIYISLNQPPKQTPSYPVPQKTSPRKILPPTYDTTLIAQHSTLALHRISDFPFQKKASQPFRPPPPLQTNKLLYIRRRGRTNEIPALGGVEVKQWVREKVEGRGKAEGNTYSNGLV